MKSNQIKSNQMLVFGEVNAITVSFAAITVSFAESLDVIANIS